MAVPKSIFSYQKVQNVMGLFIRNSKWQLKSRMNEKLYLDVGCGLYTHKEFINLDYHWTPQVDVCWDITTKPYPFPSERFQGIFTEHCLEHISLSQCEFNLKEFYRMLKSDGVLRIIVPDGELYLDIYQRKKNGEDVEMPFEAGYLSPMHRINGIFRNHGHQFIYDFATFKLLLEKSGFQNIIRSQYLKGKNPELCNDREFRKTESLYIEAYK